MIYRFNAIPTKLISECFKKTEKLVLKMWYMKEHKGPRIDEKFLKNREKSYSNKDSMVLKSGQTT